MTSRVRKPCHLYSDLRSSTGILSVQPGWTSIPKPRKGGRSHRCRLHHSSLRSLSALWGSWNTSHSHREAWLPRQIIELLHHIFDSGCHRTSRCTLHLMLHLRHRLWQRKNNSSLFPPARQSRRHLGTLNYRIRESSWRRSQPTTCCCWDVCTLTKVG